MDFRDIIMSYNIGMKEVNMWFIFSQLPLYRKIFVVFGLIWAVISIIGMLFYDIRSTFFGIVFVVSILVVKWLDRKKSNLRYMREIYRQNDTKRIQVILYVLKRAKIDLNDIDTLRLLEYEAKELKKANCLGELFEKHRNIFAVLITFLGNLYIGTISGMQIGLIDIIRIVLSIGVFYFVGYFIYTTLLYVCLAIFTPDYFIYEDFIHDLRQVMIFRRKIEEFV